MRVTTLKDCYDVFYPLKTTIFGVGVTAFMRIIPAFFLKDKFSIICYKNSLDLDILSSYTNIFCLQKQQHGNQIEKLNTPNILQHPATIAYAKKHPGSYLLVYKNNTEIETIATTLGYKVINSASEIRSIFEDKKEFRVILKKTGIQPIPGENIRLKDFLTTDYVRWSKKYGKHLVIQLPDIKNGGGLGTVFIKNTKEFITFVQHIQGGYYKDTEIFSLNITQFISGISASIIGCATKYGTLSSSIQTQLIDIPETINLKKGAGLFCGHDWSLFHFSQNLQKQASKITQTIGSYMYQNGYKGIFGLDLLIDQEDEKLYVVECNSRYTGAFPMISMLDIQKGIIPMDVFHMLEHMNIEYTIDFDKIDATYKYTKEGSHIILCNKENHEVICKKDLVPGVYTYQNNTLHYVRPGLGYGDIHTTDEFIIIDGNPRKGEIIRASQELSRFCHLLFPKKIALKPNKLNARTKQIIACIYSSFIG